MTEALQIALEHYIQQHMTPGATVTDFTPIADGWETEVYAFTLNTGEKLILRMYPGGSAAEKCAREFRVMQYLDGTGYPVPEVLLHTIDPTTTGKPFLIMRFIDGIPTGKLFEN